MLRSTVKNFSVYLVFLFPLVGFGCHSGDNPIGSGVTIGSDLLGVNVSYFNTWSESQPLANVFPASRGYPHLVPLDSANEPNADFRLLIYEGNNPGGPGGGGGSQTGEHNGRFVGQATMTADGGALSNIRYDPPANTTTFTFTTTAVGNSSINFTNTRRLPSDTTATGLQNIEITRPGHNFGDLLNSAFVQSMEAFSAFRVGPSWESGTYQTTAPVWADRGKPGGMYSNRDGTSTGGAPWEILVAMANEMQIDLWICLPPNADDAYLTNIFRTFFYGSDGINPYTDVQANPIWAPLDPKRKLYFEVGNEVWNYSGPYGAITEQMTALAETEMAAGDPYNYGYAYPGYEPDQIQLMRMRLARLTAHASQLSRDVVGDENMMTRYRPVLAGQSAWSYPGLSSLSYLKTVLGGHDWYPNDWSEGRFPGRFHPAVLKGPEDGLSVNTFGNIAQPLSYWIYGYAIAPYVDGATVAELNVNLVSDRAEISSAIEISNQAGVKPLAYEGGIGNHVAVHDYEASGLDTVLEELLYHWYANGGGLFMNYTLAGNNGWGAFPDMTRQDPMNNLKLRALRKVAGLP